MARILVAGATGHLGRHIVSELKRRNHWVRALTRNPLRPFPEADELVGGDLRLVNTLQGPCGQVDVIISAAGASINPLQKKKEPDFRTIDYQGHRNLLKVAGNSGIRRFIYVSVFSVPEIQNLDYVRAHTHFADALKASGLTYNVIRPTGFFSAFETVLDLAKTGFAPLVGDGSARTNPIHEKDLAEIVVDALDHPNREISVGGPEVLTRREIFDMAFQVLAKKPRYVRIPGAVLSAQSRLTSMFDPRMAQITSFLNKVSQVDVIAPSAGKERLYNYFERKAGVLAGS